MQTDMVTDWL